MLRGLALDHYYTNLKSNPVRDIIAVTSGCPQDNPRTPLRRPSVTCQRHVPVVYSLHDPRGLTSSRIRLSHQSILFHNRVLIAPCLQVPLTFKSFLLFL